MIRIRLTARLTRIVNITLGSIAILFVIVTMAFITIRVMIHGREVPVPQLVGMTVADAEKSVSSHGLRLAVMNRFYSTTVPAGRVLSQYPAAGVIVRHEWEVQAIESLGPQRVAIPDVVGMEEHAASFNIRRLSLAVGTEAHIASSGMPDTVLAQTPPANAGGVDSPRVSLLLSEKSDGSDTAMVMPNLVGMSYNTAVARLQANGLYPIVEAPPAPPTMSIGGVPVAPPAPAPPPIPTNGTVTAQMPLSGHRVVRGEGVRLTLNGEPQ